MQKYKDDYVPRQYMVCQQADCPLAARCLRQIAYGLLLADEEECCLRLLKPRFCSTDGHCQHYRDNTPVRFARGFANFQQKMFPQQYREFMERLAERFGRNPYFQRRRGERLLPPEEQEVILDTLRQVGVAEGMAFDAYEEKVYW